jgi:hypothetical protein
MSRTSDARIQAPSSRRALDRLLSVDEVAEYLGIRSRRSTSGDTRGAVPRHTGSGAIFGMTRASFTTGSKNTWWCAMASVERRERIGRDGEVVRRYRVRWWGPDNKQRSKTFRRKVDADRFARFETYAEQWLAAQTFDELTRQAVELRLRIHAYPLLGKRFLNDVQPSTIQGWLRSLGALARRIGSSSSPTCPRSSPPPSTTH